MAATATRAPRRKVVPIKPPTGLRRLSEVKPEKVKWLWPGYLPRGKVVIIEGDPAVGKSTLLCDLSARVTTGDKWPDGSAGVGRSGAGVLMLSAEDNAADTIVPRLKSAGANLEKIHLLDEVSHNGQMVMPELPRDLGEIEKVIKDNRVALVIVDVLMAYLSGDSYRDQAVRRMLSPLAAMAERTGATIVLIRHLKKTGKKDNKLYRGSGSIGIIGAARASYVVAADLNDDDLRYFVVGKINIAAPPPTRAYRMIDDPENGCARIEWQPNAIEMSAEDLGMMIPEDDGRRTEREECGEWLLEYLRDADVPGQAPSAEIFAAARKAGAWSPKTVKAAKADLGVTAHKSKEWQGRWSWHLPEVGIDLD